MERTQADRKEIPCGTGFTPDLGAGPSLSETHTLWDAHRQPSSQYEAMMVEDDHPAQERFEDPLLETLEGELTPIELATIQFVVYGQMSFSQAGKALGAEFPRILPKHGPERRPYPYSKNRVKQIHDKAISKLRTFLEETER